MQKIIKITRSKLDIYGYKAGIRYIHLLPKMTVKNIPFLLPQYAQNNNNKGKHDGTKAKKTKNTTL